MGAPATRAASRGRARDSTLQTCAQCVRVVDADADVVELGLCCEWLAIHCAIGIQSHGAASSRAVGHTPTLTLLYVIAMYSARCVR
eukprot:5359403-Prymnesium_polylepis.1